MGDDLLLGGSHGDTFVFADGFGNDVIADFSTGNPNERVDLSAVGAIAGFADLQASHLTQYGTDLVIDDGAGNTIMLRNVALADLSTADFLF